MTATSLARKARLSLGFTQQQMAEALGVSRSQYGMVESGRRLLPQEANSRLLGLLDALNNKMALSEKPKICIRKGDTDPGKLLELASLLKAKSLKYKKLAGAIEHRLQQASTRKKALPALAKTIAHEGMQKAIAFSLADAELRESRYSHAQAKVFLKAAEALSKAADQLAALTPKH